MPGSGGPGKKKEGVNGEGCLPPEPAKEKETVKILHSRCR